MSPDHDPGEPAQGGARGADATTGERGPRWPREVGLAAVAVASGLLYVASVLGTAPLDPTDVSWLKTDPAIHYLGWALLRQDPVVRFPPTLTDQLGFPLTISVTFLDIIPGLALALRPLSSWLPDPLQYLGPSLAVSAGSLFYVGFKTARLHTDSVLACGAAGLLLMTNSAFTLRLAGHAALAAQCFVALAVYVYAKRWTRPVAVARTPTSTGLLAQGAIAAGALAVNPYLCAMTLFVGLAHGARAITEDRTRLRAVLRQGATAGAALGAVLLACGYLGGGEALQGDGFGTYSANLNTLVNPLWFSRFVPGLPVANLAQIEGSSYLGLAGLALGAAAALSALRSKPRDWASAPLVLAALAAFVASVSNRITWGDALLLEVPLSKAEGLARVLRASGRLSWVALYVVYAVGLAAVCRLLPGRRATVALASLAALQIVELAPLRQAVAEAHRSPEGRPAALGERWSHLARGHRHLVVLPAWQCGPERSPGGPFGHITFGLLASRLGLTLNSYASARYGAEQLTFHCQTLPAALRRSGPSPDTLYVVDREWLTWFATSTSHRCLALDGFDVCLHR